jgi:hypothetical protein
MLATQEMDKETVFQLLIQMLKKSTRKTRSQEEERLILKLHKVKVLNSPETQD